MRKISSEEAIQFSFEKKYCFMETSIYEMDSVNNLFQASISLSKYVIRKRNEEFNEINNEIKKLINNN